MTDREVFDHLRLGLTANHVHAVAAWLEGQSRYSDMHALDDALDSVDLYVLSRAVPSRAAYGRPLDLADKTVAAALKRGRDLLDEYERRTA